MDEVSQTAEQEIETPTQASEPEKVQEDKQVDELVRKEAQLANLKKAIAEENENLKKIRLAKKQVKESPQENEVPVIDFNDPSAKAWGNHIRESVNPIHAELEDEKKEIRTFAMQTFLADKPSLAKNPESVKELVALYEKIRTATERTTEGVLLDLKKAYAALHADELIATAHGQRVESAQAEALASDIAVSRGGTSYQTSKKSKPILSAEDKLQLAKWGMTEDEWVNAKEKYSS